VRRGDLDRQDPIEDEYDYLEMLDALSAAGAEFLIIGAHALAVHGRPRATAGVDLWIHATPDNAARVWHALVAFGAPLGELRQDDFATSAVVYQIGRAPDRIDLRTAVTGISFEDAWSARVTAQLEGRSVPIIGRDHLIANKRALGRLRDLADLEELESGADPE
jgi:hypothetical protein